MVKLQYGTVIDSLLIAVPEIKSPYLSVQGEIGPDVLAFPIVELVLEPFVKGALTSSSDGELLRRVFAFLEQMACAEDVEVVNLLAVGIFEPWLADSVTIARALRFMGPGTKRVAHDMADRLRCVENLPR